MAYAIDVLCHDCAGQLCYKIINVHGFFFLYSHFILLSLFGLVIFQHNTFISLMWGNGWSVTL